VLGDLRGLLSRVGDAEIRGSGAYATSVTRDV
jgi:hypothetical protein